MCICFASKRASAHEPARAVAAAATDSKSSNSKDSVAGAAVAIATLHAAAAMLVIGRRTNPITHLSLCKAVLPRDKPPGQKRICVGSSCFYMARVLQQRY